MERRMELLPPPPGAVDLGDLARLTPVSDVFGYDRGNPVDRHYIETFLAMNAAAIRGCTLEIGDATYTRRFGGRRVTRSDVLHVHDGNPAATIVADLTNAEHIASDSFDCVIITQTLHLIFDAEAAVRTVYRILRPGGVMLATLPGISQICRNEWRESWYWSFTELSARQIFGRVFGRDAVCVQSHGNVLAATAFLQGLASRELRLGELEHRDAAYPVVVTVRAEKREPAALRHSPMRKAATPVPSARLSVLMVYGNAERFIAEAIESVIRQTSAEWELLLIEHGSGDCSPTIAVRYERDGGGRVRCLHYEGGEGESADAVWRWALQRARGEFVARLDPDHVWSADVVREFVAVLDSTPGALAARVPSARWQSWCGDVPAEFVPPGRDDTRVKVAPAGHDRPCGSTLAARRVELLQMTTRPGPHADAMSTLDPRIRLSSQHGNVVTGSGRVECRVRDALSGCGGLLLTTMPPALAVRARPNGDRVGLSPGDGMPISVVICTRDRPAYIAACLEAVLAQTHSAGEIIVIENTPSSDEAARLIRHYPVRHRIEAKPGLSHARNLGLACCRFDVIAFTDDDARPDPDWLRGITHAFADQQVVAVTGLVLPAALETAAESLFEHACGGMGKGARPIQYAGATMSLSARMAVERLGVGANMAFRRAAFDRVGLFDPLLGAGSPGRSAEDLDMFHRIVAAGLTLRYEPAAIVRHHHRAEMDDLVRQLNDAAYGYARYLEKLCTGVTVPGRSASLFRARWYARMIGRVVLGSLGLKDVPTALLRSQLRSALAARRTTAQVAAQTAPSSEHDIVSATGVR